MKVSNGAFLVKTCANLRLDNYDVVLIAYPFTNEYTSPFLIKKSKFWSSIPLSGFNPT